MRLEITHSTRYAYSSPVCLQPHTLRVRPRWEPYSELCAFELRLDPTPVGRSQYVDLDGNTIVRVWFEEEVSQLEIRAHSVVETRRVDPFDFLLEASATSLPVRWSLPEEQRLALYRMRRQPSRAVDDLVAEILDEVGNVTTLFLTGLARRISRTCRQAQRPWGEPNAPSVTWLRQSGACRDLAVLYVDAARAAGLPARFVSGYSTDEANEPALHAWAEVYLPGAGWLGFDPSQGLAVGDRHVAIAASPEAAGAAMVEGSYFANDVSAELSASVEIRIDSPTSLAASAA